jgi:hypothetical protein
MFYYNGANVAVPFQTPGLVANGVVVPFFTRGILATTLDGVTYGINQVGAGPTGGVVQFTRPGNYLALVNMNVIGPVGRIVYSWLEMSTDNIAWSVVAGTGANQHPAGATTDFPFNWNSTIAYYPSQGLGPYYRLKMSSDGGTSIFLSNPNMGVGAGVTGRAVVASFSYTSCILRYMTQYP